MPYGRLGSILFLRSIGQQLSFNHTLTCREGYDKKRVLTLLLFLHQTVQLFVIGLGIIFAFTARRKCASTVLPIDRLQKRPLVIMLRKYCGRR